MASPPAPTREELAELEKLARELNTRYRYIDGDPLAYVRTLLGVVSEYATDALDEFDRAKREGRA